MNVSCVKNSRAFFFKQLKILILILLQTPRLCISLIIESTILLVGLVSIGTNLKDDTLLCLQEFQSMCLWLFLFNLYLSYEYIAELRKSGAEETVFSHKNGKIKLYCLSVLILIFLLFFEVTLMTLFPLGVAIINQMPNEIYFHVIAVSFINTGLSGCFAALLGTFLAMNLERIKAYPVMALLILLILPASNLIPGIMNDAYGINIWPLKSLFNNILQPGQTWTIDYQYGLPIEPIRWSTMYLWISLTLGGIATFMFSPSKKKQILILTLCAACVISNGISVFRSESKIDLTEAPDSVFRTDQVYYRHNEPREESANFVISSYLMNLDIGKELYAHVTMSIDSTDDVSEYKFTLYHRYIVARITDENGVDIPFEQDGDYIVVTPKSKPCQIVMEYSGFSPMFYSNGQGVCLPGCFPYYPWAGFKKIYYATPNPQEGFINFIARTDLPTSKFTVQISGGKNIQTNLDLIGNKLYGQTNSLTIMGGFLESYDDGPYQIIACNAMSDKFKLNTNYVNKLQKIITQLEKEMGYDSYTKMEDYKLFQINETLLNRCAYGLAVPMENHILVAAYPDMESVAYAIVYLIHEGPALTVDEKLKSEGVQG